MKNYIGAYYRGLRAQGLINLYSNNVFEVEWWSGNERIESHHHQETEIFVRIRLYTSSEQGAEWRIEKSTRKKYIINIVVEWTPNLKRWSNQTNTHTKKLFQFSSFSFNSLWYLPLHSEIVYAAWFAFRFSTINILPNFVSIVSLFFCVCHIRFSCLLNSQNVGKSFRSSIHELWKDTQQPYTQKLCSTCLVWLAMAPLDTQNILLKNLKLIIMCGSEQSILIKSFSGNDSFPAIHESNIFRRKKFSCYEMLSSADFYPISFDLWLNFFTSCGFIQMGFAHSFLLDFSVIVVGSLGIRAL